MQVENHYKSQTNSPDLFWLRDHATGTWILGQQIKRKNGKPGTFNSTWKERVFIPATPPEMTEGELLAIFAQAETDLIFHDAAGEKSKQAHRGSLRKALDQFVQNSPGTWKKLP